MSLLKFDKRRKKCLSVLTIISVFLIVPLVLTLCTRFGYSWANSGFFPDRVTPTSHPRERNVNQYVFTSLSRPPNPQGYGYHYAVHDWISDSALRLIHLDPLIPRKYTSWILDESIPYGEFDDYPNYGSGVSAERGWVSVSMKSGSNGDDRNWMRNRRYARFLHGTGIPDWDIYSIVIDNDPIPFEACYHSATWMLSSRGHFFRFNSDGDIDFSQTPAGWYAMQAAQSAIHWLNYSKKDQPWQGQHYSYRGKYEMGAECLSGMTHFIGDVAGPLHTFKGVPFYHRYWDKIADDLVGWDATGGFNRKGGPDWSRVNPSQYSIALIPIDPWTAVKEMATLAHDYGGSHYAPSLPSQPSDSDLFYVNWVKTLLKKAVWYTACAILWVLLQCDFSDDTFSDKWEKGQPLGHTWGSYLSRYRAKIFAPPDIEEIRQKIDAVEGGDDEWDNPGIKGYNLAYLVYFAPLMAVMGIPTLVTVNRYLFEKLKEKPISA